MKSPAWEPSAGALVAFLNANTQALPVDLYTITLASGTVLRYTSAQVGNTVNGFMFAVGPGLTRSKTKVSVGLEVDTMSIDVMADATVQVGGIGIISSIALGLFDAAAVHVDHAFFDTSLTCQGVVAAFEGRVGAVTTSRGRAKLQVRSASELFDIMVPGELYQAGCRNTLYDPFCGVARATYTFSATVASGIGAGNNSFTASSATNAKTATFFDQGVIKFTSGANTGTSRTIKSTTGGGGSTPLTFTFISPFPSPIAISDAFTYTQGCDKTLATCSARYSNTGYFRGEPFIPPASTIV